jgi:hypothetical protein
MIPFIFLALVLFVGAMPPEEGMWLLDSVQKLPMENMKRFGYELTAEQIYSTTAPSVKDAIVLLGGGTGSFISPQGLVITNHHVAFGNIQQLSSVKDDYLKDGFLARTHADELSTSTTAEVIESMRDVTPLVLAAADSATSPADRLRAIQSKKLEIENAESLDAGHGCRVVDMYDGTRFYLFLSVKFTDVRLVYAPPSAIGNFGGEVDNWMWPRHTGDFAIMRVYTGPDGKPAAYAKENIPYVPKKYLPISTRGVTDSSFAMILGFPGRTYRNREASGIELSREISLPTSVEFYRERIRVIESATKDDRALAIKYASNVRRVANPYKKYLGILAGLERSGAVAKRKAEEAKLSAFIASSPALTAKYGAVLTDLRAVSDELRKIEPTNIALSNLDGGITLLRIATRMAAFVDNPVRDAQGERVDPTDKELAPVRDFARNVLKDTDARVDRALCLALLTKAAQMPVDQRPSALSELVGEKTGVKLIEKVADFVNDLYDDTDLLTIEECSDLIASSPRAINKDSFVKFARRLAADRGPVQSKATALNNRLSSLRTQLAEVWAIWKKSDFTYPDANRTLRMTFGQVLPLSPRDAVTFSATTSLTGVMEKESDSDPFIIPQKLKELWKTKDFGRYADPATGDVPVAFLTDNDITGGNSGSPVINGRGELIGCAFDGNWEGVVGDYFFEERYNRTISVDARYVLFILDKFSGAQNVLDELTIR